MKVNHASVFVGSDTIRNRHTDGNTQHKKNGNSIDGRTIKEAMDPIIEKKKKAQQKAMKIISDVFAVHQEIDNDLISRRQRVQDLASKLGEYNKSIKNLEDTRAALREEYNVDIDSQEEKDLQLLAKEVESSFIGSNTVLTSKEKEQIKKIKEAGLSEYQQRSLNLKEFERPYVDLVSKIENEITIENAIIRGIELERLKDNSMVKASNQADAIIDASNDEIMSMLIDEGKEHIYKEQEEEKKKAKEQTEKKEELEERIKASKEHKKEQEELIEKILDATTDLTGKVSEVLDAQQEIENMVKRMKLIEEDIKGVAVNKEV